MKQETIRISATALNHLLHDYAQARYLSRSRGSSYQQGREDALMLALNYCFGLTSTDVEERKDFKQMLIEVENAFLSQNEEA